jgi:zinc protease
MRAIALALGLLSTQAFAQGATRLQVPHEKYTLPNGLEVILHVDKRLPVVAVNVWYHVGAFHEPERRSGFAHLFEHMMFQGSEHVGDDQHISMLERLGATDLNGTTNFYRTNYFQTVPTHQLETALWLESDRMGFLLPALTEEKLKTQQEVVKNERRQRIETAPYGVANERLWQALFPAPHPYHGRVIGSMDDLNAASLKDVADFFTTWYAPSNATLTLAGDIEPAEAKALVEKYFGALPRRAEPKEPNVAPAKLEGEVVLTHDEQIATLPAVFMGWHTPPVFAEGDAAADVLSTILSEGKASRLHRRLVREKRIAQSVSAFQWSIKGQSVFMVDAVAAPGHTAEEVQKEIDAVLAEVREKGVTPEEVRRARNRIETDFVAGLQSVGGMSGKADRMQAYNHFFQEPDGFARDLARYEAVTPEKVQAFAREFLTPQRRAVMRATPAKEAK